MTSVKNIARAALFAAALGFGLAAAPGAAAADVTVEVGAGEVGPVETAVEIDVRMSGPGDWPWEILPILPR